MEHGGHGAAFDEGFCGTDCQVAWWKDRVTQLGVHWRNEIKQERLNHRDAIHALEKSEQKAVDKYDEAQEEILRLRVELADLTTEYNRCTEGRG